jgi:hypothetical protein
VPGDNVKCWICGSSTPVDEVKRLDNVVSLGGYTPGHVITSHKKHRVCLSCLDGWCHLRVQYEAEMLHVLSQMPGQPT